MYSEKVMEHFKHPRHFGEIKDAEGVGVAGNIQCGDVMQVFIKVKNNKVVDAKFKTYGCAAAISASDALCELVKGKTIQAASKITREDIVKFLEGLPLIKIHCSVLGIETLHEAIKNYKAKKLKKNKNV